MLENSTPSATHSDVGGALTQLGWNITECVMEGYHYMEVKKIAVHFYLNVCAFVKVEVAESCMSVLPLLAELLEKATQKSFQHSGKSLGESEKFGCGIQDLVEREFKVSNYC